MIASGAESNPPIWYFGDDDLTRAAAYLAAVMEHYGLKFKHVPGNRPPGQEFGTADPALYILSDYPARNFTTEEMQHLARAVSNGAGLLMLGGWDSFMGQGGGYPATPLADVLPVFMRQQDDRQNCAQPCMLRSVADHPILNGLPFDRPPAIGGFNRVAPKPGAQVLLTATPFEVCIRSNAFFFEAREEVPLLIVGTHGKGRTAAFASDAAPHWVGGLVDWGNERIFQKVGNTKVEVGTGYARLFRNLIFWAMKG